MKEKSKVSQIVLNLFFVVFTLLVIYPFLLVVSVSLTDETTIMNEGYRLIPSVYSLKAYRYVFQNPLSVLNAYKITAIFSAITMVLATLLQACIAFALTNKKLKGRMIVSFFLYFTMLFSGGLVPTYILNTP